MRNRNQLSDRRLLMQLCSVILFGTVTLLGPRLCWSGRGRPDRMGTAGFWRYLADFHTGHHTGDVAR